MQLSCLIKWIVLTVKRLIMSSVCPNCKSKITCGCQRRTTADGKAGCTKCISTLNGESKPALKPKTTSTSNYIQERWKAINAKFNI
jgi:Zn ribbon nucleic-acid-binding protein